MAQAKQRVIVSDLPLGTILKFSGTKGTAYRKLYKISHTPATQHHQGWYSLWGILMNLNGSKLGEYTITEDCGMTSNMYKNITHQVIVEGGQLTLIPIRVVSPIEAEEEDINVRTI